MTASKRSRPQNASILCVDDDAFTRKVIRQVLAGLQFDHVDVASDAQAARAMLEQRPYDLVLTDVDMPGVNGLELLQQIRGGLAAVARDTRVIVLTSFSNTEVLGVAMALDVNGFLVKPMKPSIVYEKIAGALREDMQPRPPIVYLSVKTDLRTLPSAARDRPVRTPEVPKSSSQRPTRHVLLHELRPGMRLADNLFAAEGTLLLSRGHMLTRSNLNRLWELNIVIGKTTFEVVDGDEGLPAP